jgi:outer membrane protein assembly factor BamB
MSAEGWQEMFDPNSNRTYYYNSSTGESSWDRPYQETNDFIDLSESSYNIEDKSTSNWVEASADDGRLYYYNSATGETSWEKPVALMEKDVATILPLPEGWTEDFDSGSNKTFYYNASTGQSSWERPVAQESTEVYSDVSNSGWVEAYADDGRPYFYHSGTGETSWERPEEMISPNSSGIGEHIRLVPC